MYVRNLIAERAREEYSALVESTGSACHVCTLCLACWAHTRPNREESLTLSLVDAFVLQ